MNTIVIDSGTSMIKLICIDENDNIINKKTIEKTVINNALDIFVEEENINLKDVSRIILTGIGMSEVNGNIYNIPTEKVDEFKAIGVGGLSLAGCEKGLVVSIGTGTAFVLAEGKNVKHIGGTGVGGGTILNLCKRLGNINSFNEIEKLISKGNLKNVDLTIQDITNQKIETLPPDTTSANFGKISTQATKEDMALGIVNMIFETIGVMAVFAKQNTEIENIIVIGSATTIPYINVVLKKIEKLHNVKFIVPKNAEFATAIGAKKSI